MSTVVKVMFRPAYLLLGIIVCLTVIAIAAWLPNWKLITQTITSSFMTFPEKTALLLSLLGLLKTGFSPLSRTVTAVSALLTGIQTSLLLYYVRQTFRIRQELGISFSGSFLSLIGVGCASCGSVILSSLIGFSAATAVLGFLPFKGQEFGFIGIVILLTVIKLTIGKINQPVICKSKSK